MHICFITHEFPQEGLIHGGIGTFVKNITVELAKKNVQVTVVGISNSLTAKSWVEDGTQVHLVANSTWPRFKAFNNWKRLNSKLKEIHRQHPIDFVETPEGDLAMVKKIRGIQYVIRMNGGHHFFIHTGALKINRWRAFQEKRSFGKADRLIAVSNFVNTETARYLSFNTANTAIIPNAINIEKFKQDATVPINENVLVFAGSLVEKKGIRQLILAMPEVIKKHPQVQLHAYGRDGRVSGTTDSYKEYLLQAVPPDCFKNVQLMGVVENAKLPGIISGAFACVYPSHMEALPLAWLEAMAMGKPFIGGKTGPGPEVVAHGIDGLLADPYDPADIARKIIYLLDNREQARLFGEAARKKVIANFNMETVVNLNIATYKSWLPK